MATPPHDLAITGSRHLTGWMAEQRLSIGFSTYQAGKLFLIGLARDPHTGHPKLSIFERTFNRAMGLAASRDGNTLWLSTLYQLWRLENFVPPGQATADGYDRLYVPTLAHTTGDIDIHDITLNARGEPTFVNTLFNCLARPSVTHSFEPVWKPPFISAMVAEDRCHLNGLAADPATGEPAYVTMVSKSDVADGWRDRRVGGGLVMDVRTHEVVCEGLSMPHSPRLHPDHPGKLFLLESGTGQFGYVDLKTGRFEPLAFCPGFTRGMAFHGDTAIVGLSAARENRTFQGLPLDDELQKRDAVPRTALHFISLAPGSLGTTDHWLRIEGIIHELFDVITLPNVIRPQLLGLKEDGPLRHTLRVGEPRDGVL